MAKTKLEKQLEDLTWRLQLEKRLKVLFFPLSIILFSPFSFVEIIGSRFEWLYFLLQVSNDEAKVVEVSKLQKTLESLNLELDAAKLATINECNKNAVLQNQLELLMKEKSALERELALVTELKRENLRLKVSIPC